MRWFELSDDLTLWTLPAARAKNGRNHLVPLSSLAASIIAKVPRTSDEFVLSLGGNKAVESYWRLKRRLDALAPVAEPWTLHDLRRTTASGLQRLGIKLQVTEAVLNHTSGSRGGIVGVYQRHDYADEKRVALERWAAHVEALSRAG
jgi:integrase